MSLDEVYQAALEAGQGGIRYNDSEKYIQVIDTDKNWVNWRPFNSAVLNSNGISASSETVAPIKNISWVYSSIFESSIIWMSGYSASANNHKGDVITQSLINYRSNQTFTFRHYNGSSSAYESITVEFIYGLDGFNQYRYELTEYNSYTTTYGAKLLLDFVFISY